MRSAVLHFLALQVFFSSLVLCLCGPMWSMSHLNNEEDS